MILELINGIRVDIKFPQNKINNFTLEEILKGMKCPYGEKCLKKHNKRGIKLWDIQRELLQVMERNTSG